MRFEGIILFVVPVKTSHYIVLINQGQRSVTSYSLPDAGFVHALPDFGRIHILPQRILAKALCEQGRMLFIQPYQIKIIGQLQ